MNMIQKFSKTQPIERNNTSNNSRSSDFTDSIGNHSGKHGVQATSNNRTPIPQNVNPKLMQQASTNKRVFVTSLEENGPSILHALDSAREHNMDYLDQIISPSNEIP